MRSQLAFGRLIHSFVFPDLGLALPQSWGFLPLDAMFKLLRLDSLLETTP